MVFGAGWPVWLAWLLAVFFLVNGVLNWIGIKPFREGYASWGLPPWFGRFNGSVELLAGVLLLIPSLRFGGLALSLAICAGIFAVLIYHRDFSHLPPGAILLVLTCLCGWGLYG